MKKVISTTLMICGWQALSSVLILSGNNVSLSKSGGEIIVIRMGKHH